MYSIGQYRSNNTKENYYTPLNIETTWIKVQSAALEDGILFRNFGCNILNEALNSVNCYYLHFEVEQRLDSQQNFYLKLKKSNPTSQDDDIQQIIEEYNVPQGEGTIPFQVVIAPNSIYNQVIWDLKRGGIDYQSLLGKEGGRKMVVNIKAFVKLKDIFTTIFGENPDIEGLTKIGVQGPPLMVMCINRQQIRIGRSGIYEINNGMKITSISFIPKIVSSQEEEDTKLDYFIMDYEYYKKEEEQ